MSGKSTGDRRSVLLQGARIVDPSQGLDEAADLLLRDGSVAAIGSNLKAEGAETVDVTGKVLVPGLIDGRAHLGEPGYEHRETLDSGLQAAAAGGFTAVVATADTAPVVDQRALVEMITRQADRLGWARLYPTATVTKGMAGSELSEVGELTAAGAVALSDGETPIANAALLRRALMYASHFGVPILHRAADLQLESDGVMHEGHWSTRLGLPGSTSVSERSIVARDLFLAEEAGGRLHVAPVTVGGALDQIRAAKEAGLQVSCDTTLHHLLLTDEAVHSSTFSTATRVSPPLRSEQDVEALKKGLQDGTIDMIVTDHRPFHADEKEDVQFSVAPPGVVGLETLVSLSLDRLVKAGIIDLARWVELLSCAPARIFGLPGGSLEVGRPGDVTVLDLDAEVTVDPSTFRSQGRSTPFAGWTATGAAVGTFVGGRRVDLPQRT